MLIDALPLRKVEFSQLEKLAFNIGFQQSIAPVMERLSMPLADRPGRTARERRETAIGVWVHVWARWDEYTPDMRHRMIAELETMKRLGQTARWRKALDALQLLIIQESDLDWVVVQYGHYAGMAAR